MPGTTINYALRYQTPSDSPDGAALGKNLAEDVDTVLLAQVTGLRPMVDQRATPSAGITGTTLVSVLQVTLPAAGTYMFNSTILMVQSVAVGRPGFALGGSSTATAWRWASGATQYQVATGGGGGAATGTTYPASTAGTAITNSDWAVSGGYNYLDLKGTVTVSAAGTLQFRINNAAGSGTVTVQSGSIASAWRVS